MKTKLFFRLILTGLILFVFMSSYSYSQNFWEKTNGPFGGDIMSMAINSNDDIFVGTSNRNGIFRSSDNGATWVHILIGTWGTNFQSFNAIAINSQDYIFAGSWGYFFRSIDNGNSWKEIKIGYNHPGPDILSIELNAADEIFAGTDNGVYLSSDSGDNWSQVGLANQIINTIQILDNTHLFAGTENGVYYSNDNGSNWNQVGLPGLSVCSLLGNSFSEIIAGSKKDGIFRSSDNGVTWMQVNNGIQVPPSACEAKCIVINSLNQIYVGFLHGGVFRSSNNGDTWIKIGLKKGKIKAIAIDHEGDIFAGSGGQGWMMFKSINDGDYWSQIDPVNANINAIAINNESGHIFIGAGVWAMGGPDGSPGIYYSSDNGNTWERFLADLGCSHFYSITINSQGDVYAGNDFGQVFRTADNGVHWEFLGTDFGCINALVTNSFDHVFAGADGVYHSIDNGNSWTHSLSEYWIMSLAVNDSGDILAGTNGEGIYRSEDNGDSWENIGLHGEYVHEIIINADNQIFVATDSSGVFRSIDNGATWEPINSGLPTNRIYSLAISPNGHIFAGTAGYGVFRSSAPTGIEETFFGQTSSFVLKQNYPNPFPTSTTIEYELNQPTNIQITIYNHLGKQVEVIEQNQSQGKQQIIWNAEGLPAGVYYCVLKTHTGRQESGTQTMKMIKLR